MEQQELGPGGREEEVDRPPGPGPGPGPPPPLLSFHPRMSAATSAFIGITPPPTPLLDSSSSSSSFTQTFLRGILTSIDR